MPKMTGWKTKFAGLGMIFTGAGTVLTAILPVFAGDLSGVNWDTVQGGIAMIGMGLGIIGIGHKIEKAGRR